MMCGEYDLQLGDYVDGTLPAGARAALAAHLATCERCRLQAADFAAIRTAARGLQTHAVPPHVWPRLSMRLSHERGDAERSHEARVSAPIAPASRRRAIAPVWRYAAAAAVLAVVAGSLVWVGGALRPAGPAATIAAGDAFDAADVGPQFALAEAQFTSTIADLELIAAADRDALDPMTADVLQANLMAVDEAIVDSRTALATEPDSLTALESLFAALRSKVALLQSTIALINEMRKGNPEEAARIIADMNQ